MIKVWGRANSSNVKKVICCLKELALPYRCIDVGGAFGGLDSTEYLKLNPNGVIPALEDNGIVLWESNTISIYALSS